MSTPIALGLYFVIWWLTLFAMLPIGNVAQQDNDEVVPGTEPGAPVAPRILRKMVWTTGIATGIFAVVYVVITRRLIVI